MAASVILLLVVFLIWCGPDPVLAACQNVPVARGLVSQAYATESDATIQYFGHNFFQISTRSGTKIITDPLIPGRYRTPIVSPHVITIGREHPHHNYVQLAQGTPLILRGLAEFGATWNRISTQVHEVTIFSVPIYQNGFSGALKGAAFVFDLGTLCIIHLGDLSHPLTAEQLQQIGHVDVALVPIDGTYTMGPEIAREVVQQLHPKIAIPMHYRDNLALVDAFTRGLPTRRFASNTLLVSKASLPATTEIVVLTPHKARE